MSRRDRKSKTSKKDVKSIFQIFTEGKETEPRYIRGYVEEYLKQHNCFDKVLFASKPKNHDPKSLLDNAKEAKVSETDNVWIVFDRDGHDKIPETFTEAEEAGIKIAFSSISFETWILMHFEYTTAAYETCDALISDPRHFKKYIPDYKKAMPELFAVATANGGLAKAIKHAERLCKAVPRGYPKRTKIYKMNPYTDFYRLLDAIDDFLGIDKNDKRIEKGCQLK